ncbi:uncharacterized protein HaLaN_16946 [Haematococcus lacustris]|uniref:Hydroxyproline O-arabinosyltransferase-like domain-containing protein n=2 Tax=Haematococcus lacustris TaxID=44745 RepID=A0A699ZMD0_HAELA|nr:uncharacterized protein HaLaN_16946 [Haematococcus lacustris]
MRNAGRSNTSRVGRNNFRLIVICISSLGLLGGYVLTSAPQSPAVLPHADVRITGSRKELQGSRAISKTMGSAPDAPEAITISTPPPLVSVSTTDQRHPDNVKLMMSQQSSQDEHKSGLLALLVKGLSDVRERTVGQATVKAAQNHSSSPSTTSSTVGAQQQPSAQKEPDPKHVDEVVVETVGSSPSPSASTATSSPSGAATSDKATSNTSTPFPAQKSPDTASAAPAVDGVGAPLNGSSRPDRKAQTPTQLQHQQGCKAAGAQCGLPGDTIHTLFTSNGSPYQNFQARIMVATWRLVRAMPGGSHLVAMTRVLHRTTPDELMDEVDTFRADPLQPECDKWCWFPVADRANAMQQWLKAVATQPSLQKAPWLLLLETDYVWVAPLPAPGNAYDPKVPGLSFGYDYIAPRLPVIQELLKERCPDCDPNTVPNSGPAPVLARYEDFLAATPIWEELSLYIETHNETKKSLGWVREMYAWDIAVAAKKLNILNQGPGPSPLIAQPPHDTLRLNATMYHYTWGSIFKNASTGAEIWKFDKRFYTAADDALKVPLLELPPPWREGVKLHDGMPITLDLHNTLTDMITAMNKGIATLPDLRTKAPAAAAA